MTRIIQILLFTAIIAVPALCHAQASEPGPIKSSAAYAEVLLRKTELQADLDAFSGDYTESHPKVVDARFELASLETSMEKIFAVKPSETGKLTAALGKLIVRRAAAAAEHNHLLRTYNADHPEVKRAKRRLELYDNAVREILR